MFSPLYANAGGAGFSRRRASARPPLFRNLYPLAPFVLNPFRISVAAGRLLACYAPHAKEYLSMNRRERRKQRIARRSVASALKCAKPVTAEVSPAADSVAPSTASTGPRTEAGKAASS